MRRPGGFLRDRGFADAPALATALRFELDLLPACLASHRHPTRAGVGGWTDEPIRPILGPAVAHPAERDPLKLAADAQQELDYLVISFNGHVHRESDDPGSGPGHTTTTITPARFFQIVVPTGLRRDAPAVA